MRKQVITLVLFVLVCPLLLANENKFVTTVSPNLRKFLIDHPDAMRALTNALSETFSNKTVRLYYFYTDDQTERRAFHYYPNTGGMADVFICVPQDSWPLDEFLNVLYETMNSKGEDRFAALFESAKAGTVSRTDFARAVLKVEFDAVKSTRDLLMHLKLSKKEIAKSANYRHFVDTPTEFEGFLSYQRGLFPPNHGPMEEYESKYDWLRKLQP